MNTYQQLESMVLPLMTSYQTDVTTHDKKVIDDNPGLPFIHVTRDSSSHIFPKPDLEWLKADLRQKYLFGTSTPVAIVSGDIMLLKTYFNDADAFHYCDGAKVTRISRESAISKHEQWVA